MWIRENDDGSAQIMSHGQPDSNWNYFKVEIYEKQERLSDQEPFINTLATKKFHDVNLKLNKVRIEPLQIKIIFCQQILLKSINKTSLVMQKHLHA